jgi:hypothetical protein
MSITKKMTGDLLNEKLYQEERSYRADRLIDKWAKIPELGNGIKNMKESDARNLAIALENQTRYLGRMTESQRSSGFQG